MFVRRAFDSQRNSSLPLEPKQTGKPSSNLSSRSNLSKQGTKVNPSQSTTERSQQKGMVIYTPSLQIFDDFASSTLESNTGCFPMRNPQFPILHILQPLKPPRSSEYSTRPSSSTQANKIQNPTQIDEVEEPSARISNRIQIEIDSINIPHIQSTQSTKSPSVYSSMKSGFLNQLNLRPNYSTSSSTQQQSELNLKPTVNLIDKEKDISLEKKRIPVIRVRSTLNSRDEEFEDRRSTVHSLVPLTVPAKILAKQSFTLPDIPKDVSDSQRHQYARRDPKEKLHALKFNLAEDKSDKNTNSDSGQSVIGDTLSEYSKITNEMEDNPVQTVQVSSHISQLHSEAELRLPTEEIESLRSKRASSFTLQPIQQKALSNYSGIGNSLLESSRTMSMMGGSTKVSSKVLQERKLVQPILSRRTSQVSTDSMNQLYGYSVQSLSSTVALPAKDENNSMCLIKRKSMLSQNIKTEEIAENYSQEAENLETISYQHYQQESERNRVKKQRSLQIGISPIEQKVITHLR